MTSVDDTSTAISVITSTKILVYRVVFKKITTASAVNEKLLYVYKFIIVLRQSRNQ